MKTFRATVLSVVKHAYVPRGVAAHPRFELAVVADDPDQPPWVHERNEAFARQYDIPYVRDIDQALSDFEVDLAVVSPEAERHCDLSIRAATAGLHVIQDKPMSTSMSECDRLVAAIEQNDVRFMMWNRNFLPAVIHAHEAIERGDVGQPYAIHIDFYFAKDAGPAKGTRGAGFPPLDWRTALIAAHADGSDGGVGHQPMGELEIEGIYPLAYLDRLAGGARVTSVFARTASHFHQLNADNDVDDLATVSLELEGGLTATLCLGRIGAASHPDIGEIKIHVLGTDGALVFSEARPEVSIHYRGQPAKEFRNRRIAIDNDFLLMNNFAHAIDTGSDTILGVHTSRAIAATVAASLTSARCGQKVDVECDPNRLD